MTTSSTAQIRQKLEMAFDDSELTAFCLNYFPIVYDKFSGRMRKDEKVTLLLDYCRRHPTGFEMLLNNVCEAYSLSNFQREQLKPLIDILSAPSLPIADTTTEVVESKSGYTQTEAKVRKRIITSHEGLEEKRTRSVRTVLRNPFGDTGRITEPERFFDRQELLRQIFEALRKGSSISLVGESQIGKSSVLSMICEWGPERLKLPKDRFAYLSMQWVRDEDEFYEALSEALKITPSCRGFKLNHTLRQRNKRYVLCLDEIEKMTWHGFSEHIRSELRGLADGKHAPLNLVIASRSPLLHLFPDSPKSESPLANLCQQLDIGPFSLEIARQFLLDRLRDTGVSFTEEEISHLLSSTQAHPAELQRVAANLYDERSHS